MKHIKLFENFKINENNNNNLPKMFITSNGKLIIKYGDKSVNMQMINSTDDDSTDGSMIIKKAVDQSADVKNRLFDASVWRIQHGNVIKSYHNLGWTLDVYKDDGTPVKDGTNKEDVYLYVSVPKGYSGEIKGQSDVMGKTTGGSRRISGKGKSTWGFYNAGELKNSAIDTIPAYKKIKMHKVDEQPAEEKLKNISILNSFNYDSFELTNDAKTEIKNKLLKYKNDLKGVWLTTGATQDDDPNKEITKKGKTLKRSDWDKYLVKNRYTSLLKYMKDLGIPAKVSKDGKNDDNSLKVYGVFDKDLKSDKNRSVLIKPVFK